MRSTDDQLREIMKRANFVAEKKASEKAALSYALSSCACIALLVVTSFYLKNLSSTVTSEAQGHYGSLMLSTSYMGYVVIGTLAFLLGVSVTMLSIHLRRMRKKGREHS